MKYYGIKTYLLHKGVFSHLKLRSCECCFKGIIDYCRENKIKIKNKSFNKVIDFLWLNEYDFFDFLKNTSDQNII